MLVFGLVMALMPASAGMVTWTFTNAVMDGQQSVGGFFVYDADTLAVSDFSISTSAGFFIGYAFDFNPGDASVQLSSSPSTGTNIIFTQTGWTSPAPPVRAEFDLFTPMLTDAGGVVQISPRTSEYVNDFPQQTDTFNPYGSGTVVGVGTAPEPSYFGIVGVGLGLLAITRRLRRSAA
jgi:hypothetical protein